MQCRFFLKGACRNGDQCQFSHAGGPPPPEQRPPCRYFFAGACRNGDACAFSHTGLVPFCGKSFGKKGGRGWKGGKGQGAGKVDGEHAGKGPGALGPPGANLRWSKRDLTGPYLGKGSELLKVWSMPDDVGHEDAVRSAVVMGERVCTGGDDRRLIAWRGEGGAALAQENAIDLPAPVTTLLYHEASRWLFCGLGSGEIAAFRQEPLSQARFAGHAAAVTSMLVHEDVLLSGSSDASVRAWKYDAGQGTFACMATVPIPTGAVAAILPWKGFCVGSAGGVCRLGSQDLQPMASFDETARVVALVPYSDRVIAALADGSVKVYGEGGEEFSSGPIGEHTTNTAVAIVRHPHANLDLLLCGQQLGYVTAYELPAFRPRGTFTTGYEGDVSAILPLGGEGVFATFGLTGDVVLWRWQRDG